MAKKAEQEQPEVSKDQVSVDALAKALTLAINATRPPEKKTFGTYKGRTPWTPPEGEANLKLKRKMYQHGLLIDQARVNNEEIALLNKVRPGRYCDGNVIVRRRKDKGLDVDYAVKTASQRMRLVQQFGIRNLKELLERCIEEASNPTKYVKPEFDDDND